MNLKPLAAFPIALLLAACGGHAPVPAPLAPVSAAAVVRDLPAATPSPTPGLTAMGFPRFTFKATGQQGDPVNILVAATQPQLERLFADTGWLRADPITPISVARMLEGTVDPHVQYPHAPMSDLYLYGRHQDYGFEKNNVGIRQRDHLRVWQSNQTDRLGRPWWAIAATKDIAIQWVNRHPTHRISGDVDAERALVVGDLAGSGRVALQYRLTALPGGYTGVNGDGDAIHTDGEVVVLELAADAPGEAPVPVPVAKHEPADDHADRR